MRHDGDEAVVTPEGTTPPAQPAAIELRGINKSFGAVRANRDVSMTVRAGSIHGIVGENGAGKSTLMSILYGFYAADSGEIRVAGTPVHITSSHEAIAAGIGMVHQHFMLVDNFTVLENVMMGAESGPLLRDSIQKAHGELTRLANEYGLHVDPEAIVGDLPVGALQRVEILKALYRDARILILDEPTGVLTPQEAKQLFRILGALKQRGVTIILITHKLGEVMAITDTVSVMRRGRMVAERATADTSTEELAELMVGRKLKAGVSPRLQTIGAPAMAVEGLCLRDRYGVARIDDIGFEVCAGEIVGIAGVSGNGQSELLEVLSGITPMTAGRIVVEGRELTPARPARPDQIRGLRLAHVPEDRQRRGLVTAFTARESSILGYQRDPAYNGRLFMDYDAVDGHCRDLMERFDVRPPLPGIVSAKLSGGNQQKLILARELDRDPKVLLVGQPTRGVDIGAIEFIHQQLADLRDRGCAILLVSVELDEIMALSDRILVMFEGRIVGEVPIADADTSTLGLMMANAHEGASARGDTSGAEPAA
ncbi:MAG: ABC transporter ATP-binding protein [Alphaproteobacteria bacterium]|nr:ABC transporter ATP-binding protein [Alphaproteobacteria bacterium]